MRFVSSFGLASSISSVLSFFGLEADSRCLGLSFAALMDSVSSFLALASHEEESFLLQSLLITDCLRDLSNLKKQFYAAAEYYEVSYRKNQHKHALLDGFNENAIKAFVHTVDNLGVMANKINRYLEDKFNGVQGINELQISSMEQELRTDQEESHDVHPHKQNHSLASKFPKYTKRYTLPERKKCIWRSTTFNPFETKKKRSSFR